MAVKFDPILDEIRENDADGVGTGDVVGPASSTDNIVTAFDSTTGKLLKETKFLSGFNIAIPNDVVPVASFSAFDAGYTDIAVAFSPKGAGSFSLHVPDGTVVGGNKRGSRAIDLQLQRGNANHVASGNFSFLAGASSRASGTSSVVIGGSNTGTATYAIAIGSAVFSTGFGAVGIGSQLTLSGGSTTGMGYQHNLAGSYSSALGYRCITTSAGSYTFLAGSWLKSSALGAFVIGKGVGIGSELHNTVSNSLWFGVNTTVPSLAVWNAGGAGLFGKVSIGSATEPIANSIFTVVSTTRAAQPIPSMTTAERDLIATPTAGLQIFNTDTNAINLYTTSWTAVGGGGASATWTEVEVDFGTGAGQYDKTFTITDAAVSAASKIIIMESGKTTTGRKDGDSLWDSINVTAKPGAGNFLAYCKADPGPVSGSRKLQYSVAV